MCRRCVPNEEVNKLTQSSSFTVICSLPIWNWKASNYWNKNLCHNCLKKEGSKVAEYGQAKWCKHDATEDNQEFARAKVDKKRKKWTFAVRRTTAPQVSSGCVSWRTKSLIMKDPAVLSLIHARITSRVWKKFASQMHGEEYEHNKYALLIFYVYKCLPFQCIL